MKSPNALVLQAPGINCDEETAFALDQAGANVEKVHIRQLNNGDRSWDDYQILAFPGGFSYGDDIASGRLLGTEIRKKHAEELDKYAKSGKAIIGICNGMQVLVETGIIPNGRVRVEGQPKRATLAHNSSGKFECRWAWMQVENSESHFITPELMGVEKIELPDAHMEGRFVYYEGNGFPAEQVPLRFINEDGEVTEEYPDNPNGSKGGVTAITNKDGNVLGMMPHPERFISRYQHYNWHRGQGSTLYGAIIFKNIVKYARES